MFWAPVGVAVLFLLIAVWLRQVGRARFRSSAIGESVLAKLAEPPPQPGPEREPEPPTKYELEFREKGAAVAGPPSPPPGAAPAKPSSQPVAGPGEDAFADETAADTDDLWEMSSDDGVGEDMWGSPDAGAPPAREPVPPPAPAAPPPAPATAPIAAGASPTSGPGSPARRKRSSGTAAAPSPRQERRRAVAYEGKLEAPTRIYVGDSASILVRLRNLGGLLVRRTGVAVSRDEGGDSHGVHVRVDAAGIEHKELEIEMICAGAAVAGQAKQRQRLDADELTFHWNCHFPNSGRQILDFVIAEVGPAGERRLGTVHHPVRVVTFAGLTKRQLGSVARTAAMISAVAGAVSALDRMGIVDILPEFPQ